MGVGGAVVADEARPRGTRLLVRCDWVVEPALCGARREPL